MINQTNVTLNHILNITNATSGDPTEILVNINTMVFGGWLFFILLCILGVLLFRMAQSKQDQPMINIMYISTALTIISFFARALFIYKDGIYYGLLTDFQLWIFPLITAVSAAVVKFTSK